MILIQDLQFYGFSDPLTMRLIERMKGYDQAGIPEDKDVN